MNPVINFNGTLTDAYKPIATTFNRSLRFGDGLFETMFWDGRAIQNQSFHLDRLFLGFSTLGFDLSEGFTRTYISNEIKRLCDHNVAGTTSRVRLNIFREDGSSLLPVRNKPVFIIESADLPEQRYTPLRLTIFGAEKKATGILSNLKTNNYLLNILALRYAEKSGLDDALILNCRENICEASSSNLFMVHKGILYTPALSEGCVAGTKRRELLEVLPVLGFPVKEEAVKVERLFEMEEVFLTNAIRGICPVQYIDGHSYSQVLTDRIMRLLVNIKE